ncbi:MAG: hypothetical protein A2Z25_15030 [Planctomycetes bacterium RBG_16_55_9]|nr:MAG: hypothetical protein A2Z25_15030 [Planctomycetes bacterium RBG_16_55_9]
MCNFIQHVLFLRRWYEDNRLMTFNDGQAARREAIARMIRTLQTISAVAMGSAVVVFAFCVIQWTRGRPQTGPDTERSIVQEFRQRNGEGEKGVQQTVPPLVKQAQAFASYLNPPEPPKPVRAQVSKPGSNEDAAPVQLPKTTPKFTLLATSYHRAIPEESLALISEPGREPRWVKQGEALGHFVLAKVQTGMIVYRDADRLGEMAINTMGPAPAGQAPETTLASEDQDASRPESSSPDKPKESRPHRPMHRLGPPRQEIHVVACDLRTVNI